MSKFLARVGKVSFFTMVSRVLGLVRDMLTTAFLGATVWNSAFITAFTLPNLFRRLLGEGALTAALMPNLSDEEKRGGQAAVYALLNKTLSWLFAVCLFLIVVFSIVFGVLKSMPLSNKWVIVANLGIILFPYILLVCLAAIISVALNLRGIFGIPALTAVWLNLSIILFLGLAGWQWADSIQMKVVWLCLGVLVGGLAQLLVPAFVLFKEGWKPRFDFAVSDSLRSVLAMTVPGAFGAAVYQINIMVSRTFAYSVNDEGATLLYLANRLVELPVGVFTIAISTVVFPAFSKAAANSDFQDFRNTHRQGLALATMMALPSAVGLILLGENIIRLLFERGLFGSDSTSALLPALYVFALGLPFVSFVSIETRALYSLKDVKSPVRVASVALVLNIGLCLLLMRFWGIVGIAVANNVTLLIQSVGLHFLLRKKCPGIRLKPLFDDVSKSLLASLFMAACIISMLFMAYALEWGDNLSALISVLVFIPVSVAIYFLSMMLLGSKAAREMLDLLKRVKRTHAGEP